MAGVVRRYDEYTSAVATTCMIPDGGNWLHGSVRRSADGQHSIIWVETSNGVPFWSRDLAGDGVVHIFSLEGFRSNNDGTMKFFITSWPEPRELGNRRQRVLVESGIPLARPVDLTPAVRG